MNASINADAAELAKFSDLAHRWWDADGEFRPLHQINPLRLAWMSGLLAVFYVPSHLLLRRLYGQPKSSASRRGTGEPAAETIILAIGGRVSRQNVRP